MVLFGEIVRRLAEDLNGKISDSELGDPFLSSPYKVYPLQESNFRHVKENSSRRRLAFVDGGNDVLIEAPNFSVQLVRAALSVFDGRERVTPEHTVQRIELLCLITTKILEGDAYYETSLFPMVEEVKPYLPDPAHLKFKSTDPRITVGGTRPGIGRVASIVRKFTEWKYATEAVKRELKQEDVLVMDGTLRTGFPNEQAYASEAYRVASGKKVVYTGLSKSSRLLTTSGLSLLGAVRALAERSSISAPWYYFPVAESSSPEHYASIMILRLNEESQRVFRYDLNADQAKNMNRGEIDEVLWKLSENACDLAFPGYPYGLVDADYNARVRSDELEAYRIGLYSEISRLGHSKFLHHMQSTDAHRVLNMLREAPYG